MIVYEHNVLFAERPGKYTRLFLKQKLLHYVYSFRGARVDFRYDFCGIADRTKTITILYRMYAHNTLDFFTDRETKKKIYIILNAALYSYLSVPDRQTAECTFASFLLLATQKK